jgi:voltage-gated potassium channel
VIKVKSPYWVSELARVTLPLALVALVAAAVAGVTSPLFFAMVLSAGLVIAVIRALFPAGRLFPVAFASLLAVYATIFSLFVEEIFRGIGDAFLVVGFCLPIFVFVVGCWLRRDQIRVLVAHPAISSEQRVLRAAVWLVPVFFIGAIVILLSRTVGSVLNMDMVFLGAMSLIGLIVLTVSRDVAVFLVDAGLLFKEFFRRVSRLVIESIYFSIGTISTVGYGDIIPYSNFARVLSSFEVFCGIMLLLFGVSEMLEYAREHRQDRRSK